MAVALVQLDAADIWRRLTRGETEKSNPGGSWDVRMDLKSKMGQFPFASLSRHEGSSLPAGHCWRPLPLLLSDPATRANRRIGDPVADLPDGLDRGYEKEVHLNNVRQLTYGGDNAEAYWSFDGKQLVFRASNPAGASSATRFT